MLDQEEEPKMDIAHNMDEEELMEDKAEKMLKAPDGWTTEQYKNKQRESVLWHGRMGYVGCFIVYLIIMDEQLKFKWIQFAQNAETRRQMRWYQGLRARLYKENKWLS